MSKKSHTHLDITINGLPVSLPITKLDRDGYVPFSVILELSELTPIEGAKPRIGYRTPFPYDGYRPNDQVHHVGDVTPEDAAPVNNGSEFTVAYTETAQ